MKTFIASRQGSSTVAKHIPRKLRFPKRRERSEADRKFTHAQIKAIRLRIIQANDKSLRRPFELTRDAETMRRAYCDPRGVNGGDWDDGVKDDRERKRAELQAALCIAIEWRTRVPRCGVCGNRWWIEAPCGRPCYRIPF